ncbi:MAG: porin [Acidobacteria bacterium]|nr:MAG: porin [Acidobacteriota bacterium]
MTMNEALARFHTRLGYGSSFLFLTVLWVGSLARAQGVAPVGGSRVEPVTKPPLGSTPAVSFGSSGILFSTHDHRTRLQVHGYLQADNRFFSNAVEGVGFDKFLFRRLRPLVEGTLFNRLEFRFMPDFGQNNPQIQEAYLELKSIPFAKLRVGKFKEPVGLEVLKSDRDLSFAERSLASDLAPLRYMGAEVSASLFSESISYAIGYFNGAEDGANGSFQWLHAHEAAARVFLRPFAATHVKAAQDFGMGAGGSTGDQHGSLAGLKTVGQNTFFKYASTAVANGPHNRFSPQAYYYGGPLGLLGEYVISSQIVLNKQITRRLTNEAWQVAGSVMLTGEKNSYTGVRPRFGFEPNRGFRHLGAIELAFRYSQLRLDANAFPRFANPINSAHTATERAIGVNWYLNRCVKLVTDYEMTRFRLASTSSTLHGEDVLMSRVQLAF